MSLRRLASMPATRLTAGVIVVVAAAALPGTVSSYLLRVATLVVVFAIFSAGLNLILGYTGLLSFGHAAFFGIGGYLTARLMLAGDVPFVAVLVLAALLAGGFSLVLGLSTWRVRGDYLALVTLGFGEIANLVMRNWTAGTRGQMGIPGIPFPGLFGFEVESPAATYRLCLALLVLVFLFCRGLTRSYFGRALLTIREDEIVARAHGINVRLYKVLVFGIGGAIAGLAGALQVVLLSFAGPESFTLNQSVQAVEIVVIGGMGTAWGPILGAAVVLGLSEALRSYSQYRTGIFGFVLIVVLYLRPDGIAGLLGLTDRHRGRAPTAWYRARRPAVEPAVNEEAAA